MDYRGAGTVRRGRSGNEVDVAGVAGRTPARPEGPAGQGRAAHWDGVYAGRAESATSWFQAEPGTSLQLLDALDLDPAAPVVDVGAGASRLVDALLDRGHRDVTVLDMAPAALASARSRLGPLREAMVDWIAADLLEWAPARRYRVWHDRAVFHFLTDPAEQAAYRAVARQAVAPGGFLVVGTFALGGPTRCSGLPVARYDPDALAEALAPGFTPVLSQRETHHTPWDAEQPFTWVVLRRVDLAELTDPGRLVDPGSQ